MLASWAVGWVSFCLGHCKVYSYENILYGCPQFTTSGKLAKRPLTESTGVAEEEEAVEGEGGEDEGGEDEGGEDEGGEGPIEGVEEGGGIGGDGSELPPSACEGGEVDRCRVKDGD